MSSSNHQELHSFSRRRQFLCNERCQNILYKTALEHFIEIKDIAVLLLTSKSFQNSSFGANFLVNFAIDEHLIRLLESVLSPSSCFSLQLVPSLCIGHLWMHSSNRMKRRIGKIVGELVRTKYLHRQLRSLSMQCVMNDVVSYLFGSSGKTWTQLQELTVENRELDDKTLELISKSALQLRSLNLSGNREITDAGIAHLSNLRGITFLNLSRCDKITDSGLEHLSDLSNVTYLDVSRCDKITDAGLEHISKLSDITKLDLTCCSKITDVGLDQLSKCSSTITSLILDNCKLITDIGLEHISKLSGLTHLDIRGCNQITYKAAKKIKVICKKVVGCPAPDDFDENRD